MFLNIIWLGFVSYVITYFRILSSWMRGADAMSPEAAVDR